MAVAPAPVWLTTTPIPIKEPSDFIQSVFIQRSFSPFQYMPFGGGHRRCIGAAFASFEIAIVLGTLLKRYQIELIDRAPVVPKRRSVTMGPSPPSHSVLFGLR